MPLDAAQPDLSPTARLILLALASGPLATGALRSVTGTETAQSFWRAIAKLESRNLIVIVRTPGLPNVYARVV